MRGVVDQAQDALWRMKRLQDLHLAWRKQVTRKRASANLLKLVDLLFEKPVLTVRDVSEALGVTPRGARKMLHRLVEEGIVEMVQQQYKQQFRARPILDVLIAG